MIFYFFNKKAFLESIFWKLRKSSLDKAGKFSANFSFPGDLTDQASLYLRI